MSLLEKIKTDLHDARKAKNICLVNILSTIYAEAQMVGKNAGNRETTDAEVVAKIKVFIKNIEETLKSIKETHAKYADLQKEKSLLEKYLPKQMSEAELTATVVEIAANHEKSIKSMGKVMADLKAKYSGQYDGNLASQVVKKVLGG